MPIWGKVAKDLSDEDIKAYIEDPLLSGSKAVSTVSAILGVSASRVKQVVAKYPELLGRMHYRYRRSVEKKSG